VRGDALNHREGEPRGEAHGHGLVRDSGRDPLIDANFGASQDLQPNPLKLELKKLGDVAASY
jgi:hypothetical protein